MNQPDFKLISYLAGWAATAYGQATVSDPRTDAEALVTLDGENIIVAFRGSSSVPDFIADAKFRFEELLWSVNDCPVKVHRGFLGQFESITEEVILQVRQYLTIAPAAQLYITGHSLGGALAILCALNFHRQKIPVAGVVTFGAPRVGNKLFATIYNAALKDITWQVVAAGDPVPLLPPLLNGYRDSGTELFIRRDGGVQLDPFIGWELMYDLLGAVASWRNHQLALIPNHLMANYRERITATEIMNPIIQLPNHQPYSTSI